MMSWVTRPRPPNQNLTYWSGKTTSHPVSHMLDDKENDDNDKEYKDDNDELTRCMQRLEKSLLWGRAP